MYNVTTTIFSIISKSIIPIKSIIPTIFWLNFKINVNEETIYFHGRWVMCFLYLSLADLHYKSHQNPSLLKIKRLINYFSFHDINQVNRFVLGYLKIFFQFWYLNIEKISNMNFLISFLITHISNYNVLLLIHYLTLYSVLST